MRPQSQHWKSYQRLKPQGSRRKALAARREPHEPQHWKSTFSGEDINHAARYCPGGKLSLASCPRGELSRGEWSGHHDISIER